MPRNTPSAADRIQYGLEVLRTYVSEKTSKLLVQLGSVVGKTVDSDGAEWIQHVGFISRAPKAEAGKRATQTVTVRQGDRDIVIASQDLRGLELAGNQKDGETTVYAAGEDGTAQARVALKGDGSINVFTTETNTEDGKSVYLRVAPDGFAFVAPWGTLKFDRTGFHVVHSSGASMNMGGIGGLPPPFDQLSSYFKVQAGTVTQSAAIQSNGEGPNFPLANATAVQAAISGLQAQITALQAAIAIFANPVSNPLIADADLAGGTGLLAAATGGAAAGISAVSAASTQIPTTTTSA